MRRLRQPVQIANSLLRLAIRQVFARPLLTGSLLLVLAPAGQTLTLGDINIRSALGQRLDATVPVRLGAGEALTSTCVAPGHQAADLRSIPGAAVTTPEATREGVYQLRVTSASALYEPMYELALKVQCPGAPVLIRQYVLMLDLPGAVASSAALAPEPAVVPAAATTAQSAAAGIEIPAIQPRAMRPLSAASQPGGTIETGARYRVVAGDSLSSIAARVRSRKVSLWALAGAIQSANPDAFIRSDANLIKLGSEILIPAATATAAPEPVTAPVPVPVAVPAPVTSPVIVIEPPAPADLTQAAQPESTPAEAAQPESTPAEAARPRPVPAPVARRVAVPTPSATVTVTEEAAADEPNPVVAAGAGILFGLCISALLWFRRRLPSRQRLAARPAADRRGPSPLATPARATAKAPLVTRSIQPAFSVSYTPPADDTVESEFAGEDITSELEDLFESTDTTIKKRLNAEKTMAARALSAERPEESAPRVIEPGSAVDLLASDPTDEDATSPSGTVDIHSLSASATENERQSRTLLEALTLLERDYEEELTASQVLDMSAVRAALGNDLDEPAEIRDSHIREASTRKKSR
jgi:hypothetical protein